MAMALMSDGHMIPMRADKALAAWNVILQPESGTAAQRAFVRGIRRLYLNVRTAPESYLRRYHPERLEPAMQARLPYKD